MQMLNESKRLSQSASALGAALLGFGIGGIWGSVFNKTILIVVLVIGSIIHVAGMYLIQMRNQEKAVGVSKVLWISAWICLLALVAIFIFLSLK